MSLIQANPLPFGSAAPDFSLPIQDDTILSLKKMRGKSVVLYFYPKDNTPGCTKEACGFRDHYAKLQAAGVILIGVSGDSTKSHAKFAAKYDLPFPLLSDPEHKLAQAYGVWGEKTFMGRKFEGIHRTTFLIDPKGVIKKVWTKVKPEPHAAEVLEAVSA